MKNFIFLQTGREVSKTEDKQHLVDVQEEKGLSQMVDGIRRHGEQDETRMKPVQNQYKTSTKPVQNQYETSIKPRVKSRMTTIKAGKWQVNGTITARIWKYAAMLMMVLTVGTGEMWG